MRIQGRLNLQGKTEQWGATPTCEGAQEIL